MKAIKRRRLTVQNIQQITNAMNLVATSKLQKAKSRLAKAAALTQATFDIVHNVLHNSDVLEVPLIAPRRNVKKIAYVLITSNKGLCGGYNLQICRELLSHATKKGKDFMVITIGTKGRDYLARRNYEVEEATLNGISFESAAALAKLLMEKYASGEVDEIYLAYTRFLTVLTQEPIIKPVLPLSPGFLRRVVGRELEEGERWENLGFFKKPEAAQTHDLAQAEYEPGLEAVIDSAIPWFLNMYLFAAFASSNLCEEASRMTSMDSATTSAGDIIDKLTLQFNRRRQSIITQEITEIVSGANALN